MSIPADPGPALRAPLTRERVLRAAVDLADRDGIGSLSMRKLAQELGVEAMSLYHHVANKDAILDGIVDVVFSEIELPSGEADWKAAMRQRAISAREALRRHFEVDAAHVVVATLAELAAAGDVKPETVTDAIQRYDIDADAMDPRLA